MADRGQTEHPPASDPEAEDFVFHLARGSELLKQDRVHDAKQEIERALSHQPSDPKGQDLLGVVYFRLGLYPRAIVIYEALVREHPDAMEPRVNLALCYLKTGQAPEARAELERVVEHSPQHTRAWGYLGLAYQRLGDVERASFAFQSGGYTQMARRVSDQGQPTSLRTDSLRPPNAASHDLAHAADDASRELEREGGGFRPDPGVPSRAPADGDGPQRASRRPSGLWSATEPGRPTSRVGSTDVSTRIPAIPRLPTGLSKADGEEERARHDEPRSVRARVSGPEPAESALREGLVVFPREGGLVLDERGVVLAQTEAMFVARLDRVVSLAFPSGLPELTLLQRRGRGRELGDAGSSPLYEIRGRGELILAPRPGFRLRLVELGQGPLYVREAVLSAMEPAVSYEHGRLPLGEGDAVVLLQLRGPGAVVLELPEQARAIELSPSRSLTVRGSAILGWSGRAIPRALGLAEAGHFPERGMALLTGEGIVLLDSLT